tara:strand:- start:70 stop:243 length:174 start_codon:yes stop_codon:yes gene_type:complete
MNIQIGNKSYHFQIAPLFGLAIGYIYYEPEQEGLDEEWDRHQILLGIFALIITTWKN